jgi:hypothetical protein
MRSCILRKRENGRLSDPPNPLTGVDVLRHPAQVDFRDCAPPSASDF